MAAKLLFVGAFLLSSATGIAVVMWPTPKAEAQPVIATVEPEAAPPTAQFASVVTHQAGGLSCYILGGQIPLSSAGGSVLVGQGPAGGVWVTCEAFPSGGIWIAYVTVTLPQSPTNPEPYPTQKNHFTGSGSGGTPNTINGVVNGAAWNIH